MDIELLEKFKNRNDVYIECEPDKKIIVRTKNEDIAKEIKCKAEEFLYDVSLATFYLRGEIDEIMLVIT